MIGWLCGTVREFQNGTAIVETGGVGYEVHIPSPAGLKMFGVGDTIELYIHTHVREDALSLFGFLTSFDKQVFLQLIQVSGIGPKTALGILSAISPIQLIDIIRSQNMAHLQGIPGIGKKTAERLMLEMKDRIKNVNQGMEVPIPRRTGISGHADEVVSALVNLGYKPHIAENAVSQIDLSNFTTFDKILKESLKRLSR